MPWRSSRPSSNPLIINNPAPKAKNASGSGLASGRRTMRVMFSTLC